jgi:hypothetical protein
MRCMVQFGQLRSFSRDKIPAYPRGIRYRSGRSVESYAVKVLLLKQCDLPPPNAIVLKFVFMRKHEPQRDKLLQEEYCLSDVTSYGLVEVHRRFGRRICLHF